MSKRRGQAQDSRSQGHGKRSRPGGKKHLYLVLDDWEKGYSIRQIDPDTMLPDSDGAACTDQDPTPLPEPAAFRFVASAPDTQFAATGSSIVVVSSAGRGTSSEAPTLVYDTGAAALAVAPPLPGDLAGPILAAAGGDALYALTTFGAGLPAALEAFSWARCTRDADEPGRPTHEWSWKTVAAPPPPFVPGAVASYAAHPDGRTVFVSTRDDADGGGEGTYSFDAERREWSWLGAWALPFRGQGHYDRELDAWVGLDGAESWRVRACQVASRAASAGPPESDRTEEELFRAVDGGEGTRSAATLAYMGGSRFCLVESVGRGDVDDRVVRVTVFGLKFDRKGKLRTTSHRTTSSYVAPNYVPSFSPVAFWM